MGLVSLTLINKMNCELMLTYDNPAYMFNVYKNQPSRQTGSRNVTGPKTLPTIWGTYMKLVTKYQISAINSCWEKCDEKYLGRTDRGKTVYPPPVERGYHKWALAHSSSCLHWLIDKRGNLKKRFLNIQKVLQIFFLKPIKALLRIYL